MSDSVMAPSAKVLIVDDHDIVRHGVRSMLRSRPEWEICGEAANGQEALELVSTLKPDIVVLDLTMPVMNGLDATVRIRELGVRCRILIFTMHESDRLYAEIRQAGADGCVQKSRASLDLVRAIDTVLSGDTFFSPHGKVAAATGEASNRSSPSN